MPGGERVVLDDLGTPVRLPARVTRVVSLVPSLTESVAATRPQALVGATDWCTHPSGLAVRRVRGTKNPKLPAIVELRPDVVLANREENRRSDVEALRAAGVAVWVTVVEGLEGALTSLRRMFQQALGWPVPCWLEEAALAWSPPAPALEPVKAVVPVWRDPWMVVGRATFAGDVLARLGVANLYADHPQRYPRVALGELREARPGLVVLPDEPYPFTADDGPEAFPATPVALVDGRSLTWYGPSLTTARAVLAEQVAAARTYG